MMSFKFCYIRTLNYKIEKDEELAMDNELSHLRKDRVFLKDEIYTFLKNS